MLVVHGLYYFGRKTLAFRSDYCRKCAGARMAYQTRSFEVGHVFWIPLLPRGFWKRWSCAQCGHDPHYETASNGAKWLGIVLLSLLSLAVWTTGPKKKDDVAMTWGMRFGLPGCVGLLAWGIVKSRRAAQQIRNVAPYGEPNCPLCRTALMRGPQGRLCAKCGIVQVDVGGRR